MSIPDDHREIIHATMNMLKMPYSSIRHVGYGAFADVYSVDNTVAIKVFNRVPNDDFAAVVSLYELASNLEVGPKFYGEFHQAGVRLKAIAMEPFDTSLDKVLGNKDIIDEIGRQVDDLLLRMAVHGWACLDLKPGNFVVNVAPPLVVRMIDFDGYYCVPHQNYALDNIVSRYIIMKTVIHLTCSCLQQTELFGRTFSESETFAVGVNLVNRNTTANSVVKTYCGALDKTTEIPLNDDYDLDNIRSVVLAVREAMLNAMRRYGFASMYELNIPRPSHHGVRFIDGDTLQLRSVMNRPRKLPSAPMPSIPMPSIPSAPMPSIPSARIPSRRATNDGSPPAKRQRIESTESDDFVLIVDDVDDD